MPEENTTDPTPTSIYNEGHVSYHFQCPTRLLYPFTNDVPNVSTFANRRGKMGKSTARIAIHVTIMMPARYTVRYDL